LWELGFFQDTESNRQAFRLLKERGYVRYDDLPLRTKDGSSREVEFVSNIYAVDEQWVIQCNIRDITARKLAEKALSISETSLRQSQKLEAMGRLSGGIAHDFNNLLTVITGYADLAQTMVAPEGALRDTLDEILKAGERATGLTRQLLAFSRQQILAPKILGLNAIITDMRVMLARLIGESLFIFDDLDPDLGFVKVDLVQMQQILMNLVINARDSMPNGGEITITTRNSDLDREYAEEHPEVARENYVMLSVRDRGTGMAPDVKARIFDPFFTTKQIGKGSGMGLATVQGIVGQSGGYIMVESSLGKGSEFRIYLPRMKKEEQTPEIMTPMGDKDAYRGSETVLLAEDEEMVRTLVRTVLELSGYKVLESDGGAAALALARTYAGTIDLLLTDMLMNGLSGRELAESFLLLRPDTRVLFMSGYSDDLVIEDGLLGKEGGFVQKPFAPTQLIKAVREALDRSRVPMDSKDPSVST
ncbi:MAG: ATP-binding protein, partial [Fibrobacteria bacterium]